MICLFSQDVGTGPGIGSVQFSWKGQQMRNWRNTRRNFLIKIFHLENWNSIQFSRINIPSSRNERKMGSLIKFYRIHIFFLTFLPFIICCPCIHIIRFLFVSYLGKYSSEKWWPRTNPSLRMMDCVDEIVSSPLQPRSSAAARPHGTGYYFIIRILRMKLFSGIFVEIFISKLSYYSSFDPWSTYWRHDYPQKWWKIFRKKEIRPVMLISLSVVRYGTGTAVINILRRMFLAEQRNKTSRSSNTTYTTAHYSTAQCGKRKRGRKINWQRIVLL